MSTLSEIEEILAKPVLNDTDRNILLEFEPKNERNLLYSFFTPIEVCEIMYKLAVKYGFSPLKGKVLEPACGNGHFLTVLPNPKNITAFELDPLNFRISQKLVPEATIYNNFFETAFLEQPRNAFVLKNNTTWLPNAPFDLVIGNPPYGTNTNHYSDYFKNLKIKQVEQFFMLQSMKLLKKGGLLVFITSSNFMRNDKTYKHAKELIGEYADFVDAIRMNDKTFKNTKNPTDIIIFRRK